MKHYKKISVTREENQFDYKTCDSCGKISKKMSLNNWSEKRYGVDEVEIRHKYGSSYPEGESCKELIIDMCPDCFECKVLPFLTSIKVITNYKDTD